MRYSTMLDGGDNVLNQAIIAGPDRAARHPGGRPALHGKSRASRLVKKVTWSGLI